MTERGLPTVGGAPACPFVAFDDDRDERATSPDHRHRCYAEAQPAPRALAHQEAYCLSSSFPVCPTFQDWARREAARARPPDLPPEEGEEDVDAYAPPLVDDRPPRRGSREAWSAPPPWMRQGRAGEAPAPGPEPGSSAGEAGAMGGAAAMGGGLSGSIADRFASGREATDAARAPEPPAPHDESPHLHEEPPPAEEYGVAEEDLAPPPRRYRERYEITPDRDAEDGPADVAAPSWERPRRLEAYPTLRSRRLPASLVPPILIGIVALVLAAAALFLLPTLLGMFGSPSGSPGPSAATVAPSVSMEPTPEPAPTPFVYVVKEGDTLTKIAKRFHISLAELIAANRETHPNPDLLAVGDELIIPIETPTEIPAAPPEASPEASP